MIETATECRSHRGKVKIPTTSESSDREYRCFLPNAKFHVISDV